MVAVMPTRPAKHLHDDHSDDEDEELVGKFSIWSMCIDLIFKFIPDFLSLHPTL